MHDQGAEQGRMSLDQMLATEHPVDALALELLGERMADLGDEAQRVIGAIHDRGITSRIIDGLDEQNIALGDRLADRVAAIGGSWPFIIGFGIVMALWMALNTGALIGNWAAFDPYPFIFLNLMLSTLAALQAPVIMMSQNRQARKDRIAAAHDYEVNLRAELEIVRLHRKVDAVLERLGPTIERERDPGV